MLRKTELIAIISVLFFPLILNAQDVDTSAYQMTPLFSAGDSIVISIGLQDEFIYEHKLRPRQTLYSLSRFFGWDVFSLYDFNSSLNTEIAEVGDTITVPIKSTAIKQHRNPFEQYIKVFYKVRKKDNPFAVRHRYFQIEKEQFYNFNPRARNGLDIGENLFIGYIPLDGLKKDTTMKHSLVLSNVYRKMASVFNSYDPEGISKKHGMGYWNPSLQNQSGFFVICDNVPKNTYVEITNPMNGRSAYAQVISHIPSNTFPHEVMIIVSPAIANYIGVMDSRFFVKMRYLHQNK